MDEAEEMRALLARHDQTIDRLERQIAGLAARYTNALDQLEKWEAAFGGTFEQIAERLRNS